MSERWPRTFLVKIFFGFFFRWKRKSELFFLFSSVSLSRDLLIFTRTKTHPTKSESRWSTFWPVGAMVVDWFFYFFGVLRGRGG
jgi:hypothetical protein